MSKITLKPLDDGQKAVDIPVGKTTIGRGPLLGCSDKKVSRNHAVLEVTSKGEVFLTPTHVNPCFYQPTADSPGQILKKDVPHKLENGDSFSLLPRAFRYQLIVTSDAVPEKKADQNDLNKQCAKTNGAATDGPESVMNDKNKEPVKGINNEELNNDSVASEKFFSKDDELLANIDKNSTKDENTFSKKNCDIKDDSKSQFHKEDKKMNEDEKEKECIEKTKSPIKENSFDGDVSLNEKKASKESTRDVKEDKCTDDVHDKVKTSAQNDKTESLSKVNDSHSVEGKNLEKEKPKSFNVKVIEENESTLGGDGFPKDKVESDDALSESDKKDSPSTAAESENKRIEHTGESNGDGDLDNEASKDEGEEDSEKRDIPDWMPSDNMPPPTKGARKKSQAAKQPLKGKQPVKRKSAVSVKVVEDGPKPKGRRKSQKLDFDDGGEGNSQRQVAGRTSSRTNRQTRQGLSLEDFIVSDDDEWQSDRSEPKQRRKKRGSRRNDDSGSDWEIDHKKTKKPAHKIGSGSESGSDWGAQKKKKGPKGRRRKNKQSTSEAASEDEGDQSTSQAVKSDKKLPCMYGKKCYRRNPNHLDHFSHPGDSGNESESETPVKNDAVSDSDNESNKKECPFGANCFRKNAQHKKDFKHTKKVRPQREAAKQADKKTKSSRNSEEVDSYDLNDSFLNDDSDEYKPVDSGSDYESGKMKRFTKGKTTKNKRGRKV